MPGKAPENIHAGHRARVKARVLETGFSGMQDHEVLELMLFYAVPRADTNALSHRLLSEFGNLAGVLNADFSALLLVPGVGEQVALLLSGMGELDRRAASEGAVKRTPYRSSQEVFLLAKKLFAGASRERFVVLCFDASRRLKKTVQISEGTPFSTEVNLRKIVEAVLTGGAAYTILAHNHPDGDAQPSLADVDTTRNILIMLRKLECILSDHVIVGGDGSCYSMASDERFSKLFL